MQELGELRVNLLILIILVKEGKASFMHVFHNFKDIII